MRHTVFMRRCTTYELDKVRALAWPDEQLIFGSMVSPLSGRVKLGPQHNQITFDIFDGLDIPAVDRWIDDRIGGTPVRGFPGCLAQQMHELLEVADRLILSTRRLLIIDSGSLIGDRTPQINWSCTLDRIVHMQPTPRLLRRGWFSIYFIDRSSITLSTAWFSGHLSRRYAQEFAALSGTGRS